MQNQIITALAYPNPQPVSFYQPRTAVMGLPPKAEKLLTSELSLQARFSEGGTL